MTTNNTVVTSRARFGNALGGTRTRGYGRYRLPSSIRLRYEGIRREPAGGTNSREPDRSAEALTQCFLRGSRGQRLSYLTGITRPCCGL